MNADLGVALGGEFRREKQEFTPSALLLSNDSAGDRSSSGVNDPRATEDDRPVFSVYADLPGSPVARSTRSNRRS